MQPNPFMLPQASCNIKQIRRRRIAFWAEKLVEGLHMNPGLLAEGESTLEQSLEIPPAMHHAKNKHVRSFDRIDNHILTHGKAP